MMFGETSRFKEEENSSSHFSFWNVAGAWAGPPWTSADPVWPGDVRITGGAFVVPVLNSPPVMNGGPACQENVAAPHSLNWSLPPIIRRASTWVSGDFAAATPAERTLRSRTAR